MGKGRRNIQLKTKSCKKGESWQNRNACHTLKIFIYKNLQNPCVFFSFHVTVVFCFGLPHRIAKQYIDVWGRNVRKCEKNQLKWVWILFWGCLRPLLQQSERMTKTYVPWLVMHDATHMMPLCNQKGLLRHAVSCGESRHTWTNVKSLYTSVQMADFCNSFSFLDFSANAKKRQRPRESLQRLCEIPINRWIQLLKWLIECIKIK